MTKGLILYLALYSERNEYKYKYKNEYISNEHTWMNTQCYKKEFNSNEKT